MKLFEGLTCACAAGEPLPCAHATIGQPSLTSHHYQRGETIRWDPAADNPNRCGNSRSSKGYNEANGVGVLVGPALGGFLAIQCRDADCLRQGIIPGGKSRGNLRPFFVAIGSIQCPLPEKRARPFTSQLNIANMATRHQFEENCVSTAKRARTESRRPAFVPAHLGKQLFADAVGADGVAHCWCCGAPMLSSCEECVMHMARTGEKVSVGVRGHTTAENSGPTEPNGPTVRANMKLICMEDNANMGITNMVTYMRKMAALGDGPYAWTDEKELWAREHEAFIASFVAAGEPTLLASRVDAKIAVHSDGSVFVPACRPWSVADDEQVEQLAAELTAQKKLAAKDSRNSLQKKGYLERATINRVAIALGRTRHEVQERIEYLPAQVQERIEYLPARPKRHGSSINKGCVTRVKGHGKWKAKLKQVIPHDGIYRYRRPTKYRSVCLGTFNSEKEATEAYMKAVGEC